MLLGQRQVYTLRVVQGLMTPRPMHETISEILPLLSRNSGKYRFSRNSGKRRFREACFMLKLYQNDMTDLLLPPHPMVPDNCQQGGFIND